MRYNFGNGRSMVEMLGVLSVDRVYGCSIAMAEHRANEVANSVSVANKTMLAGQDSTFFWVPGIDFESKTVTDVGKDAYIVVDIGDNKAVCKQLKLMFENSEDWHFVGDCN